MHHEQDMRNYGGLRKKIPFTFWTMVIGTLAITGVGIPLTAIGFAGFLSKDAIIESAWAGGTGAATYGFWLLVISALMTSFYSWRLIFMTFFGRPRGDHHAYDHAHESPRVMLIPLGVLAAGAILAGMIWYKPFFGNHDSVLAFFGMPAHVEAAEGGEAHAEAPVGEAPAEAAATHAGAAPAEAVAEGHAEAAPAAGAAAAGEHAALPHGWEAGAIFMAADNHVMDDAHHAPVMVKLSPFIAMLIGLGLAYWFYILDPTRPVALARNQPFLYRFLLNKWYFDEIYDLVFVRPAMWLGTFLWKRGDGGTIDGFLNGLAMGIVPWVTRLSGRAQSGYLFHYAFAMVIGLVVLTLWLGIRAGG
jgi:NADH-quinone oxidoreductase subunit L